MAASKKLDFKEILFPTLSLFLICFVMTGALAVVNAITKEPIAANEKLAAAAAREDIFPGARFEDKGGYFIAIGRDGAPAGYCIDGEAQGYGGPVKVTVGVDAEGSIIKVQVVNCDGETPGLGQKVKEEGFLQQFAGKSNMVEVDGIASATYSSKGVEAAINLALQIYDEQIGGGEAS
jgi:electron transport complex protein RnfG